MIRREFVDELVALGNRCDEADNEKLLERVMRYLEDRVFVIQGRRKNTLPDLLQVRESRAEARARVLYERVKHHEGVELREQLPEELEDLDDRLKIHWLRVFRETYDSCSDRDVAHRAAKEAIRRIS